jgi:hypothetical protein
MQAIFNELSAPQLAKMSESQAIDTLLNLIQVCKHLQALDSTSSFKMRINERFWRIQLDDVGTIMEFLNSNNDLSTYRNMLYAVTTSPYLPDEETDIDMDRFLDGTLVWEGTQIDADSGIRVAYAYDPKPAPLISFATDDWRELKFINVIPISAPTVKLVNIATTNQIFETHFDTITTGYLELESANPTSAKVKDILPNKNITNAYLSYFQLYVEREEGKVLNNDISVSQIKDIGGVVAKVNGWVLNEKYSKINKRLVFSHNKKSTVFIAIDTEKGDFEVHNSNKNDNHLGAISFDGEKTEASKGHKLKFEY